jgi:hypothetical protein
MDDRDHQPVERLKTDDGTVGHPTSHGGRGVSRRRALVIAASLIGVGGAGIAVARTIAPEQESTTSVPAPEPPSIPSIDGSLPGPDTGAIGQTGPVEESTSPGFAGPALPPRAVSMWINTFERPTVAELPTDVRDTVNLVIFAMAQSAESGTGILKWEPGFQSYDDIALDISRLTAADKPVLLGIGGSNDGGITLVSDKNVNEFCGSIRFFVETFGFTGIDIDLEPSGSSWSQEALVKAVRTLKDEFGQGFLVGLTVALYGEHTARWLSLANELGNDYDYWSPMLYDYPEAHDERLVPDALKKIQIAVDGGVPSSKQILGFMCNAYYNTSPVEVTAQVWDAALAKYPDLRGAFIWESKLELASNYQWTREVGATLISAG